MFAWCPWADVLYGQDADFWKAYMPKIKESGFTGLLIAPGSYLPGIRQVKFPHGANSGLGVLNLALHFGASRVLLIGYDAQHTGGQKHCHGDHPKGLGNAGSVDKWPTQFRSMFRVLPKAEIVNCSRVTRLDCFKRGVLEAELARNDEVLEA